MLHFDEVAGGVISRNQGILGTGCFGYGGNSAVKDMPAESIDLDAYFLPDVNVGNLRFFVVGGDPFVVAPYKIGDGLSGLYELSRFEGAVETGTFRAFLEAH